MNPSWLLTSFLWPDQRRDCDVEQLMALVQTVLSKMEAGLLVRFSIFLVSIVCISVDLLLLRVAVFLPELVHGDNGIFLFGLWCGDTFIRLVAYSYRVLFGASCVRYDTEERVAYIYSYQKGTKYEWHGF